MSGLALRALQPGDARTLAEMMVSQEPWRSRGSRVPALEASIEQPGWEVIVAAADGRPAGMVLFQVGSVFGLSGYVRLLAVDPACHGRGLGRLLMNAAEDRMFRQDPNVFLLCTDTNLAARGFYEARGYRAVGVLHDYVVPGIHEVLYRKIGGR